MSLWGGLPSFSALVEGTLGKFNRLLVATAMALPAGSSVGGAQLGVPTTRADAGAATTPDITDHGKTIRLTNATPVVNLPSIATTFDGYEVTFVNQSGGNDATFNRNGADQIDPGATTFKLQAANGFNVIRLRVIGGVWFTTTRRFKSANQAFSTSNNSGSFTHNLGVAPSNMKVLMVCTTIDVAYEVGDILSPDQFTDSTGSAADVTTALAADSAAITWQYNGASLGRALPTEGTGALGAATLANWAFYVIAEYTSGL